MKLVVAVTAILTIMAAAIYFSYFTMRTRSIAISKEQIGYLSWVIKTYKSDQGHYPTDPASSELLASNQSFDSDDYIKSSAFLYRALTGGERGSSSETKNYIADFPHGWIRKTKTGETYFVDDWGHSLGYSTFKTVHPESSAAHNPTFDFWSTGGDRRQPDIVKWIKNW